MTGELDEYWERDWVLLRETAAILAALGVNRSYQAVFHWVHRIVDSGSEPLTA